MKQTKIGLFGFGNVGQGLYNILHETRGIKGEVEKIGIKNPEKKRSLLQKWFTTKPVDLIQNENVDIVVELINDENEAFSIVKESLENNKNVVTANKKMLAYRLKELIELQKKHQTSLLYEASVCGSIPIIRNLEEYYDNDLLHSISGIFSGSVNYILSKMFNEKSTFEIALQRAQELGFSEENPEDDINGTDSLHKLVILALHGFGLLVNPNDVFHFGISTLHKKDIKFAVEKSKKIKLVSRMFRTLDNKVIMYVMPSLVNQSNALYSVENEYNAVIIGASFSNQQILLGKGSGGNPTASAVLSDINALTYSYKYEYKKMNQNSDLSYSSDITLTIYLRFNSKSDLQHIKFEQIYEKYYSAGFNYIIGKIHLDELISSKDYLLENNLFIAEIN
ncbi:MAG: homoserine dehydrogenase [Flavobacteriales bacterium]|nr:homoserine dehydrogenase [Flavobacteriales bacterium]